MAEALLFLGMMYGLGKGMVVYNRLEAMKEAVRGYLKVTKDGTDDRSVRINSLIEEKNFLVEIERVYTLLNKAREEKRCESTDNKLIFYTTEKIYCPEMVECYMRDKLNSLSPEITVQFKSDMTRVQDGSTFVVEVLY